MKRSEDRMLTTHTGSLPPPAKVLPFLLGELDTVHASAGDELIQAAVHDAVAKQIAAGIDVVSDGEMGKPGFAHYVMDRLTGFQGQSTARPFAPRDLTDFPDVA